MEKKKIYDKKNLVKSYKKFYNENLKKKHIIIFVIMLIIFFIMLILFMNNLSSIENEILGNQAVEKTFLQQLVKEKFALLGIIVLAGITPFFFLSVLGIFGSCTLALEICYAYLSSKSILLVIIGSIGCIIQIIAISLCVATGIYYCIQSTKKFRYNQHINFGLKDVKKAIYEIKKEEEKLKKLQEIQEKKAEDREKLNVKIPYINLVISFVISTIIITIGAIIVSIV